MLSPSSESIRDALDFLLPEEVAKLLRTTVKQVYVKPIKKQYDGRRVLYRRSDVVAYLESQQAPKNPNRKTR